MIAGTVHNAMRFRSSEHSYIYIYIYSELSILHGYLALFSYSFVFQQLKFYYAEVERKTDYYELIENSIA